MNILVLSSLYPRPNDPSYGIFVHRQLKSLQKIGLHVTVLSSVAWSPRILSFSAKWRAYASTPHRTVWEDVPVYYTRYLRLPGAWFRAFAGFTAYQGMVSLASQLHRASPFDVIHSNFLLPDGLAGIYLGQKLKLPTVCTVHGSDGVTHPHENRLNLHYARSVVRRTGQMVVPSEALKRTIDHLGEPSSVIRVVHYGVDVEEYREAHSMPIGEGQGKIVAASKPYILFVGRDIRRKGLKDLLMAFAQLADGIEHKLVVVGPTLDEVRALAPGLADKLTGRLVVAGCLPPREIPTYMQNCEMFVLPSYVEGLPNVVLEAMACSKPVIATEVMGIPEQVTGGVTGLLIQPGDVSTLARSIQALIDDPARAHEMGKRGREKMVREFSWEQNASQMAAIYQAAVDAKAATTTHMRNR